MVAGCFSECCVVCQVLCVDFILVSPDFQLLSNSILDAARCTNVNALGLWKISSPTPKHTSIIVNDGYVLAHAYLGIITLK